MRQYITQNLEQDLLLYGPEQNWEMSKIYINNLNLIIFERFSVQKKNNAPFAYAHRAMTVRRLSWIITCYSLSSGKVSSKSEIWPVSLFSILPGFLMDTLLKGKFSFHSISFIYRLFK